MTLTQLVFTHNCEHGWIYGEPARFVDDHIVEVSLFDSLDVQFGPEQIVAVLSTEEEDDDDAVKILDEPSRRVLEDARVSLAAELAETAAFYAS